MVWMTCTSPEWWNRICCGIRVLTFFTIAPFGWLYLLWYLSTNFLSLQVQWHRLDDFICYDIWVLTFSLYKYNLSSWFFAAAMANLRPQNLPLSALYCKFYYFSWKILVFTILKPKWFFLSDKVPKVRIVPFFYFPIIVLKLPVCLKVTVIMKAVQSVFKLLLLPAVTSHLNRVLSSFSFTRVTICVVIYAACCFVCVFAAGVLFPCTWFLTRYGKIHWFRSEKGKICSPCYYTPTTFIIQQLDPLQSSQFSLH